MSKRTHGLAVSVAVSVAGAAFALGGTAIWAGCSGSVETVPAAVADGGPLSPDTGVRTTPVTDSGGGGDTNIIPVADATLPPQDSGNATFPGDAAGIRCGASVCSGAQVCCGMITDGGGSETCAASCPDGGFTVGCDGPEDCTAGGAANLCCADFKVGAGTAPNCPVVSAASSCVATCNTKISMGCPSDTTVRLCHALADCANEPSGATDCCQITRNGQTATFCVDPAFKPFIPGAMCL